LRRSLSAQRESRKRWTRLIIDGYTFPEIRARRKHVPHGLIVAVKEWIVIIGFVE